MKKLLAILLAVVMVLGLAACGSGSGDGGKPTIVGTWEGKVNMGGLLGSLLGMEVEEEISIKMALTFAEDGTFTAEMDQDSAVEAVDAIVDVTIKLIEDAYAQQGQGSLEDALAAEGMTIADLKAQYKAEMDMDEMFGETSEEGYYKYEEGKIYTAEDKDDLDSGDYSDIYTVTLELKKLTIADIETDGESSAELMPDMFPMIFNKK